MICKICNEPIRFWEKRVGKLHLSCLSLKYGEPIYKEIVDSLSD
jgi:hypothetical protein